MKELIQKIKQAKAEKKITTRQISETSGFPESTISRFLSGQTKNPSLLTVYGISNAVGIPLPELFSTEKHDTGNQDPTIVMYERLIILYERSLARKNRWIRNLSIIAIVCAITMAFIAGLWIFDILNGDIGFVRY